MIIILAVFQCLPFSFIRLTDQNLQLLDPKVLYSKVIFLRALTVLRVNLQLICCYCMALFTECFVSLVSFHFISHYIAMPFTNGDLLEPAATDNTSLNSASAVISPAEICIKNVDVNTFSSYSMSFQVAFLKLNGVYVLVSLQLRCRNDSILSTVPEPPDQSSIVRRSKENPNSQYKW